MDALFWQKKWQIGEINFHMDRPHPLLQKYFSEVPIGKILVPLCGKSTDMIWLRSRGHEVIGIELSPIACEAFFKENKISYREKKIDHFQIFEGEGVSLYCGDFFLSPDSAWEGVTYIYDRAALIALPQELRQKYAQLICDKKIPLFLISLDYKSPQLIGPPFSVPENEIKKLYESHFEIKKVSSQKDFSLSDRPPKYIGIEVLEEAYFITLASREG